MKTIIVYLSALLLLMSCESDSSKKNDFLEAESKRLETNKEKARIDTKEESRHTSPCAISWQTKRHKQGFNEVKQIEEKSSIE